MADPDRSIPINLRASPTRAIGQMDAPWLWWTALVGAPIGLFAWMVCTNQPDVTPEGPTTILTGATILTGFLFSLLVQVFAESKSHLQAALEEMKTADRAGAAVIRGNASQFQAVWGTCMYGIVVGLALVMIALASALWANTYAYYTSVALTLHFLITLALFSIRFARLSSGILTLLEQS